MGFDHAITTAAIGVFMSDTAPPTTAETQKLRDTLAHVIGGEWEYRNNVFRTRYEMNVAQATQITSALPDFILRQTGIRLTTDNGIAVVGRENKGHIELSNNVACDIRAAVEIVGSRGTDIGTPLAATLNITMPTGRSPA
jgi:hypothetical protein